MAWSFLKKGEKGLWFAQGTAIALFMPWLTLCLRRRSELGGDIIPVQLSVFFENIGIVWTGGKLLHMTFPGWITAAGVLVSLFLVLGAVRSFKENLEVKKFCAVVTAVTLTAALLGGIILGKSNMPGRYLIGVSPLMYILAVLGVLGFAPALKKGAVALLLCILLTGTAVQLTLKSLFDPNFKKMSAQILKSVPEGMPVVHTAPYWYVPLNFYYDRDRTHVLIKPADAALQFMGSPMIHKNIVVESMQDPYLKGKIFLLVDPVGSHSEKSFHLKRNEEKV